MGNGRVSHTGADEASVGFAIDFQQFCAHYARLQQPNQAIQYALLVFQGRIVKLGEGRLARFGKIQDILEGIIGILPGCCSAFSVRMFLSQSGVPC